MTTPLISLLPGNIDASGFWPNDAGAAGSSVYDLDTKVGTAGSITRTADSETGLNMTTLSTAADCVLRPTTGTDIMDSWSFVLFGTFGRGDIAGTGASTAQIWDSRESGTTTRQFLFYGSTATTLNLGRQSGPPHASQTASFGRLVFAGRFHSTAGKPQDLYVSGGVDQRNWIPTTPAGVSLRWVTLFGNRSDANFCPSSLGEMHVWDSLLPDLEFAEEIKLLEAKWGALVSEKSGGNF